MILETIITLPLMINPAKEINQKRLKEDYVVKVQNKKEENSRYSENRLFSKFIIGKTFIYKGLESDLDNFDQSNFDQGISYLNDVIKNINKSRRGELGSIRRESLFLTAYVLWTGNKKNLILAEKRFNEVLDYETKDFNRETTLCNLAQMHSNYHGEFNFSREKASKYLDRLVKEFPYETRESECKEGNIPSAHD
jgi:hypothetical protein